MEAATVERRESKVVGPLSGVALVLPLIFGAVASFVCYAACGDSLGLYFGGVAFAAILAPQFTALPGSIASKLLACALFAAGILSGWAMPMAHRSINWGDWHSCAVVLVAFIFAVSGVSHLLSRLGVHPTLAAAFATATALLWLAWPIWLAPHLSDSSGSLVAALVKPHPLFAINAVLIDQGVWTQQKWMYRLTNLGQDIAYTLPRSVWPSVVVNGVIATLAFAASSARRFLSRP